MKGIELPINILIIVAVAVIVLIAIVAMFYPAFSSGSQTVSIESAKSGACQILVEAKKCSANTNTITMSNFDADKDKSSDPSIVWAWGDSCNPSPAANGDNLAALCACYYQISGATAETDCRRLCGCS